MSRWVSIFGASAFLFLRFFPDSPPGRRFSFRAPSWEYFVTLGLQFWDSDRHASCVKLIFRRLGDHVHTFAVSFPNLHSGEFLFRSWGYFKFSLGHPCGHLVATFCNWNCDLIFVAIFRALGGATPCQARVPSLGKSDLFTKSEDSSQEVW